MTGRQIPHHDLVSKGLPRKGEIKTQEDAVSSDIKKVKEATGRILNMVRASVSPVAKTTGVQNLRESFQNIFDQEFLKKILRFVGVAVFLIIFIFISSYIYKLMREAGDLGGIEGPSPTVGPFRPYKPSIYADDEKVKQMDEDAKVLNRELSTVQLKETILTPPVLDFNINFKE